MATTDPARLALQIDALDETGTGIAVPNFNVAPTTEIVVLVVDDARRLRRMRWGLLPPWVPAAADGGRRSAGLINARAETVATSPAFRAAARRRRCLVPMDGYYEWMPNPRSGPKTPFYFFRPAGEPLLAAGLWSADPTPNAAIITTEAVGELARVHHRMPLLLEARNWDRWLNPDEPAPSDLLRAAPDVGGLEIREVSTLVNRVANNGPDLIVAAGPDHQPVGLF